MLTKDCSVANLFPKMMEGVFVIKTIVAPKSVKPSTVPANEKKLTPFQDSDVVVKFYSIPEEILKKLLFIRELIFEVAANTAGVGKLTETLKWGDPSYLTEESGSGSLVRVNRMPKGKEGDFAVYFHCGTRLVRTFRTQYPNTFKFEGKRAIIFNVDDEIPVEALRHCMQQALTYNLWK